MSSEDLQAESVTAGTNDQTLSQSKLSLQHDLDIIKSFVTLVKMSRIFDVLTIPNMVMMYAFVCSPFFFKEKRRCRNIQTQ